MREEGFPIVSLGAAKIIAAPGAHYRLVSAKAALVGCDRFQPDVVAIETPQAFVGPLQQALRELYPVPCVVVGQRRGADSGYAIPVAPSDSICQATRWAAQQGVPVVGVDLPIDRGESDAPAALAPFDDWIWDRVGLPEGLRLCRPLLARGRTDADQVRERFMVQQLRALTRSFRCILWVGGAAHWETIAAGLVQPGAAEGPAPNPVPSRETDWNFSIALLDPAVALRRYLDDLPRWTWEFHGVADQPELVAAFDKWAATEKIIADALEHFRLAFGEPSPRAAMHFEALLKKMLAHRSLLTPRLAPLYQAGHAAVSKEFADLLLEKALDYPIPPLTVVADGREGYPLLTEADADGRCLRNKDQRKGQVSLVILHRSPTHVSPQATKVRDDATLEAIRKKMQRAAQLLKGDRVPERWETAVPENVLAQELFSRARARAREMLQPERHALPFTGSLGEGVDVRATIRSLARGQQGVYVIAPGTRKEALDSYEPIVWHLADPGRFLYGTYQYGWKRNRLDRKDWYYYSFFWASIHHLEPELIRWDWGISVNFAPVTWGKPQVREFIRAYPERVPTTDIFAEGHTTAANVLERMGAAAVQYARRAVVWVSPKPETIPASVKAMAAAQGKRLVHVGLDCFSPEELARLGSYHLFRTDDPSDDIVTPREVLEAIERHRGKSPRFGTEASGPKVL